MSTKSHASFHEDLSRHDKPRLLSDRAFGLVFGALFIVVGLAPVGRGRPAHRWALGLAVAFVVVSLVAPRYLTRLNRLWTRLGTFLQNVTTPLVMGLVYFLVFTPIGLILRLTKHDSLRRRGDRRARSYWIPRKPPGPGPESMHDQF